MKLLCFCVIIERACPEADPYKNYIFIEIFNIF
jgi:hypothetical protein